MGNKNPEGSRSIECAQALIRLLTGPVLPVIWAKPQSIGKSDCMAACMFEASSALFGFLALPASMRYSS